VKFQPILGDKLSGKLGGIVASHNTYGSYFRKLVRPVNRKTDAQQAQRQAIAAISSSWRNLDPTVQATWIASSIVKTSRKGDRVNLSGQAAYMYVNVLRFRLGLSIINAPPAGTGLAPVLTTPSLSLTAADSVDITFATDTWNATDGGVIISGGMLNSAGKSFVGPTLAVAGIDDPGLTAVTVPLPVAIPIGGRMRLEFHATAPDGTQTTYVSADVENPSFPPPSPLALNVISAHVEDTTHVTWHFDGTPTTADASKLLANGVAGLSLIFAGPYLVVEYTGPVVSGNPWSIVNAAATVPASNVPQSGLLT
jgi:hypothetical protein